MTFGSIPIQTNLRMSTWMAGQIFIGNCLNKMQGILLFSLFILFIYFTNCNQAAKQASFRQNYTTVRLCKKITPIFTGRTRI